MKDCPRCGRRFVGVGALSRTDNATEICSSCGAEEAIAQFNGKLQSQMVWPV